MKIMSTYWCSCSVTNSCLTLCDPHGLQHARLLCPPLFSQSLLKFMFIGSVMLSNHLILCCPLLLLPSIFPSIRVFSNELTDSLWPTGLQHTRIPCSSLLLRVYSDSCPLRQWCYLTTSSSAALFSFCLQSSPSSRSFPMRSHFTLYIQFTSDGRF